MIVIMNGTIGYTIRPYDTIWMLAQVFNTTVDSIMELNPGIEPRNLLVGQVVTLAPGYSRFPSYSETPEEGYDTGEDTGDDTGTDIGTDSVADNDMVMDLTSYFRMLWEQHVTWTRIAVMALVHDLPETQLILQRLLRNPVDFADALRSFYGEEAARELAELFTAHLTIAAELVQAAKAGDEDAYAEIEQRWYDNADQIAAFLGSINPYWNEEDWSAMLEEHLALLGANVAEMLAQNYAESINGYDDIELQALEMADMMAEGIAMQFPD